MRRVVLALGLLLFFATVAPAQTLRIFHIDVEQADAALIVMPHGRNFISGVTTNKIPYTSGEDDAKSINVDVLRRGGKANAES